MALSSDDEEAARNMKQKEELSFIILYGLDVDETEEKVGTYVQKNGKTHLQPAQFILKPDGTVALACYSSGAVGRLDAEEALERVEWVREHGG